MTKYQTPPPHSETEAAQIRKRNQDRIDSEAKRKVKIRREIEARREAKELGISFEEYMGDEYDESS